MILYLCVKFSAVNDSGIERVDVDKVIRDKSPRLAKWLPGFAVSYLKKVVHQDEVNYILGNFSHLEPIEFVRATLEYMGVSYTSYGLDDIPADGRYLFVSNHPFGGLDGLMLLDELTKRFGRTRIIVNDILMNLKPLAPLFIPINKHGRQNAGYAREFKAALTEEGQVATFPAGLCSRKRGGEVCDLTWKSSFVKNAIESERDVVPVFFGGELSPFFYRLANFRTGVGLKANIEMLYLVDEMFRQRGRHSDIIFGKPIKWKELAESLSPKLWMHEIRKQVYDLQNDRPDGQH